MRFRLTFIAIAAALLSAGCDAPQNYMTGAGGPAADSLAWLGWFSTIVFSGVTILVWLLLLVILFRRRGSFDEHAPADDSSGQSWVVIGGFAIPVAILAVVFIVTLETMDNFPMENSGGEAELTVIGKQWWFDSIYTTEDGRMLHSPTEIHIPTGRPVQIALKSGDVIHSFWIPKLHGKVDTIPGQTNHIRIQADEPGVYQGQCAEFCGVQHANMRLQVIAHEPADYEAWLAYYSAPAAEPSAPQAQRGKDIFMGSGCPVCHTVRGTDARGTIGPDLTHVGSRRRIAGGMLANKTANLAAWVTHAQSLKPGVEMPNMTMFSGDELRALVAYLQSLE